ncbi:MAG TPA: hypothetical protein VG759_24845, partial [Candidatus Angelobacter sp.]|nr:hypothetical protein [Candidatus Angelobacter sp.]
TAKASKARSTDTLLGRPTEDFVAIIVTRFPSLATVQIAEIYTLCGFSMVFWNNLLQNRNKSDRKGGPWVPHLIAGLGLGG